MNMKIQHSKDVRSSQINIQIQSYFNKFPKRTFKKGNDKVYLGKRMQK